MTTKHNCISIVLAGKRSGIYLQRDGFLSMQAPCQSEHMYLHTADWWPLGLSQPNFLATLYPTTLDGLFMM